MHALCFEPATLAFGMYVGHKICARTPLPRRMFCSKRMCVWLRRNGDDLVDIVTNELSDTSLDIANHLHHVQLPVLLVLLLLLVALL